MNNVSVEEVPALQQTGVTYVDVRSTPEFNEGHAPGAVHVPLLEPDEDTGVMMPNPDFIRVMKATAAADAALVVGCQSGRRSARAVQMLQTFGFTNVTNVAGGFADWQARGLPVDSTASDYERRLAGIDA